MRRMTALFTVALVMVVGDAAQAGVIYINEPETIVGVEVTGDATFGPPLTSPITGELVLAQDAANAAGPTTTDACTALINDLTGRIALVDRGICNFTVKVKNAQTAGAIAVVVADNIPGQPVAGMGGVEPTITIPSVRITFELGVILKAALPGVNITLTPSDTTPPTVEIVSPADGTSYTVGSTVSVQYSCVDGESGISTNGCTAQLSRLDGTGTPQSVSSGDTLTTLAVGSYTLEVTATDKASNTLTLATIFTVFETSLGGRLETIAWNEVKAGSRTPVVFSLGGDKGVDIFASPPTTVGVDCTTRAPIGTPEPAPAGSGLRHNGAGQQYNYLFATDSAWIGTCRQLTIQFKQDLSLGDFAGGRLSFFFMFK